MSESDLDFCTIKSLEVLKLKAADFFLNLPGVGLTLVSPGSFLVIDWKQSQVDMTLASRGALIWLLFL